MHNSQESVVETLNSDVSTIPLSDSVLHCTLTQRTPPGSPKPTSFDQQQRASAWLHAVGKPAQAASQTSRKADAYCNGEHGHADCVEVTCECGSGAGTPQARQWRSCWQPWQRHKGTRRRDNGTGMRPSTLTWGDCSQQQPVQLWLITLHGATCQTYGQPADPCCCTAGRLLCNQCRVLVQMRCRDTTSYDCIKMPTTASAAGWQE
jgi:hypothetical protein